MFLTDLIIMPSLLHQYAAYIEPFVTELTVHTLRHLPVRIRIGVYAALQCITTGHI